MYIQTKIYRVPLGIGLVSILKGFLMINDDFKAILVFENEMHIAYCVFPTELYWRKGGNFGEKNALT